MALATATPALSPTPQMVGDTFVEQYYSILQYHPDNVFRFYEESSSVSRPNSDGVAMLGTTIKAIDNILDYYKGCIVEVATIDSQPSYNEGVFICVTGCMTCPEKIRRKFVQTFLLVYRGTGMYFVLNDVLRFTDETQLRELTSNAREALVVLGLESQEGSCVQDYELRDSTTQPSEGLPESGEELEGTSENWDEVGISWVSASGEPSGLPVAEERLFAPQTSSLKESYASIVRVKGNTLPVQNSVPTAKARPASSIPEKPMTEPSSPSATLTKAAQATEASATGSTSVSPKDGSSDVGYPVYVKNLPLTATVDLVEMEFKKFGPITPDGVQVIKQKAGPGFFAFVEFESMESMQNAIMASRVFFGHRPAFVEPKRTTKTKTDPGRNDNFRGNGGFFGTGRSDYRDQGGNPDHDQNYHPRSFGNGAGDNGIGRRDYRNTAPDRAQNYQPRNFQNKVDKLGSGRSDDYRNQGSYKAPDRSQNYQLRKSENEFGRNQGSNTVADRYQNHQPRNFQNGVGSRDYRNQSSNSASDRVQPRNFQNGFGYQRAHGNGYRNQNEY